MMRIYIQFVVFFYLLLPFQVYPQDGSIGRGCFGGSQICEESIETSGGFNEKMSLSKNAKNQLVLQMSMNRLNFQEKQNITGGQYNLEVKNFEEYQFIQEESLVIPNAILAQLGLDVEKNIINSGAYPIRVQGDKIEVAFTLH